MLIGMKWVVKTVPTSCGVCHKIGTEETIEQDKGSVCLYDDYPGSSATVQKMKADRIVACLNFMEGISSEEIEQSKSYLAAKEDFDAVARENEALKKFVLKRREDLITESENEKNCPLVTGLRPCQCDLPRCPKCGYTKHDAQFEGDHRHCDGVIPEKHGPHGGVCG